MKLKKDRRRLVMMHWNSW